MSRSNMAKSRTDKAGKSVSAPTPAQVHDIVPGKYNDQDWYAFFFVILICDEGAYKQHLGSNWQLPLLFFRVCCCRIADVF